MKLVVVLLMVTVLGVLGYAALNTGPNCPGMHPGYIGWCK